MSHFDYYSRATMLSLLALSLSACGLDPFSQLISNKLRETQGDPAPYTCPQAMVSGARTFSVSSIGKKKKVRIGNESAGDLDIQTMKPRAIKAGTELVATYVENCQKDEKQKVAYREFRLEQDQSVSDLEVEAQQDPCLIQVAENFHYRVNITKSNDIRLDEQKHFDAINAFTAYDTFYNATTGISKETIIAIIDSGVDLDHEDLKNNIWHNTKDPVNGKDDDGNGFIDDNEGWNFAARPGQKANDPRPLTWPPNEDSVHGESHGTHVAGLAGAVWNNTVGGAGILGRNVKMMAVNVFGDSPEGSTAKLNQGIRYAVENGADVINLSVGACGFDRTTYESILYAVCHGVLVVTAAGNSSYKVGQQNIGRELSNDSADANAMDCDETLMPPSGPRKFFQTPASFGASIHGLITVGSTDAKPDLSNHYSKSNFSAWSPQLVEIGAPGSSGTVGLLSTLRNNTYGFDSGTSMASPIVAAAAALAKSYAAKKGTALTPMALEKLVKAGARHEINLDPYVLGGKHLDLSILANEINTNLNSYK